MDLKVRKLQKAVHGIKQLNDKINTVKDKDDLLIDGLKNGLSQKFEYSTELLWKAIKKYLFVYDGIEAKSPKKSIKEFYLAGHINEENYMLLIKALDVRNYLSHIYNDYEFQRIYNNIPKYIHTFLLDIDRIKT